MKHVQQKLAIIFLSLLVSSNAHAWGSKRPSTPTTPTVPSTPSNPTTPTTPTTPPPITEGAYVDQIKALAAGSSCAAYSWKNRSKAPAAYIKGMALNYARSYCRIKTTRDAPTGAALLLGAKSGDAAKDALPHYASNFSALAMNNSIAGIGPLRSTYTLGIGLGMRESSGKYCEGRDMSASNTSAETAEAGMFQTSYNSMSASPELSKLYAEYKANPDKCLLDVYSVGIKCSSSSNAGSGEGLTYQKLNKSCPAFAAEYAMMMLRVRRNHYGPINRKEAEVIPACKTMLENVEAIIESDPYSCDELI